jgi:hypothetical protein
MDNRKGRGERDINDAIHFLKEIPSQSKQDVFAKVSKFRPFVPSIEDTKFQSRFDLIWERVHGKS